MPTLPLSYMQWNDRLASHFFQPSMSGRQVYLYVTEELLMDLGTESGAGVREFVETVKLGSPGTYDYGLCQKAHHSFLLWRRNRKLPYPPYVAYLGLFVLAAGLEGEFAANAYYPRLRMLIGEPMGSTLPSFDLMHEIWDDLERWSNYDKHTELGIFTVRAAGSWKHVGLPIAQTILTEHERRALPVIFANANLNPISPPSDSQLVHSMLHHGERYLRPRTVRLLGKPSDSVDAHDVLIRTIKDELSDWDCSTDLLQKDVKGKSANGVDQQEARAKHELPIAQEPPLSSFAQTTRRPEAATTAKDPSSVAKQVHASLRLCIPQIDRVAGTALIVLRCSTKHEFPEIGLRLSGKPHSGPWCCEEVLEGWSSPLVNCDTGVSIDASQFDWTLGLELHDERCEWRAALAASPVHIFISGAPYGLPGLVEVSQLPRSTPFHLAVIEARVPHIREWGQRSCQGFKELQLRHGLPPKWHLFSIAAALSDDPIKYVFPNLSFSQTARLALRGGIRSSRGNSFFFYGLPDVILEGGDGSERVYCNGQEIERAVGKDYYLLPSQFSSENELIVEARCKDEAVPRLCIYVTREIGWQSLDEIHFFDKFGRLSPTSGPELKGVAGACLSGVPQPDFPYVFPPHVLQGQRVYLLGRIPGQISVWPAEPSEQEWRPIWAIQFLQKKRGHAIFLGGGADELLPLPQFWAEPDRKRLRQWKETLWYRRKRIVVPQQPSLRALWLQYQEAARDLR